MLTAHCRIAVHGLASTVNATLLTLLWWFTRHDTSSKQAFLVTCLIESAAREIEPTTNYVLMAAFFLPSCADGNALQYKQWHVNNRPHCLMKTISIAVGTSRSTPKSDPIVRQMIKVHLLTNKLLENWSLVHRCSQEKCQWTRAGYIEDIINRMPMFLFGYIINLLLGLPSAFAGVLRKKIRSCVVLKHFHKLSISRRDMNCSIGKKSFVSFLDR